MIDIKKICCKKSIKIIIAILLVCVIAFLGIRFCIDQKCLVVNNCDVQFESMKTDIKIALVSDLHSRVFGKDNCDIVELVKEQEPDIIAVVGDMTDRDTPDFKPQLNLLEDLLSIAPVYYTPGNHEFDILEENPDSTIFEDIKATGVTYLDASYKDVEINGQTIRIGGLFDYAFFDTETEEEWRATSSTYKFLSEFEQTQNPKIILCHRPDSFVLWGNIGCRFCDVDLILSGHTHGGIMQLPVMGGFYVPEQGVNPEYYHGLYSLKHEQQIVITSGFYGHDYVPRIFNRPEIMMVNVSTLNQ